MLEWKASPTQWIMWKTVLGNKVEQLDHSVKPHINISFKYEWDTAELWDTMKRPNLQSRCTEKNNTIMKM